MQNNGKLEEEAGNAESREYKQKTICSSQSEVFKFGM